MLMMLPPMWVSMFCLQPLRSTGKKSIRSLGCIQTNQNKTYLVPVECSKSATVFLQRCHIGRVIRLRFEKFSGILIATNLNITYHINKTNQHKGYDQQSIYIHLFELIIEPFIHTNRANKTRSKRYQD